MAHKSVLLFLFAVTTVAYGRGIGESAEPPVCPFGPMDLEINTPELYEQFIAGWFDGCHQTFTITSGAHPNVLAEAKSFADNTNENIKFVDEHDNFIELSTTNKHVKAQSTTQRISLSELPTDYKSYRAAYENGKVVPVAADVDAMSKWTSAEDIVINLPLGTHGKDAPGLDFWNRLDQLQKTGEVIKNVEFFGPLICHFGFGSIEPTEEEVKPVICPFGPIEPTDEEEGKPVICPFGPIETSDEEEVKPVICPFGPMNPSDEEEVKPVICPFGPMNPSDEEEVKPVICPFGPMETSDEEEVKPVICPFGPMD